MGSTVTRAHTMRLIDRTGDRYGRLTVIERLPAKSKTDTNARWYCRCDCGRSTVAYGQDLERGKVKSCGCLNAERIMQHGYSGRHVYGVWQAMRQRCENPKAQRYADYGARGIRVCDEWRRFENFLADMGDRPQGYSLDRIDNDGPYSKENCRWTISKVQNNNKRDSRVIEFRGEKRTLAEWADHLGLEWSSLRGRIDRYGWDLERALTTPPTVTKLYEFNGKTLSLRDWAVESGIPLETLRSRVSKLKWSIDRALTEPPS